MFRFKTMYFCLEKVFRKLSFQQRMNPVEVVNFTFLMPAEDQEPGKVSLSPK